MIDIYTITKTDYTGGTITDNNRLTANEYLTFINKYNLLKKFVIPENIADITATRPSANTIQLKAALTIVDTTAMINRIDTSNLGTKPCVYSIITTQPTVIINSIGGTGQIILKNNADYTTVPDDMLIFYYDGTDFKEANNTSILNTNTHSPNQDQYLDFGGTNQVSAAQVKTTVTNLTTIENKFTGLVSAGRQPVDVDTSGNLGKMVYDRYGFVDPFSETTISFNDSTRVFTLARTGASFRYYRGGIMYTISADKTVTIPNTTGRYFIYIDAIDGTLTQSTSAWTLQDTKVPVAIIKFNNSLTPKSLQAEERHPYTLDRADHYYLHTTNGSRLISGGNLLNTTTPAGNPSGNVDNCFGLDLSAIIDENITNTISAFARPNGSTPTYFVKYRNAVNPSAWSWVSGQNVPYVFANAANIYYDNNGVLTQVTNNQFVNYYVVLTNYKDYGCVLIAGQAQYASDSLAYAETLDSLDLTGLGSPEFVFIAQLTFECRSTYSAASGNAKLVRYKKINNSFASVSLSPSTTVSSANVNVSYTPTNYTAAAANLNAHLTGIDAELSKWKVISSFNSTPPSTSTITTTADLTGTIKKGFALKLKVSGTYQYAIIDNISATTITIKGVALSTASNSLTEVFWCDSRNLITYSYVCATNSLNATNANDILIDASGNAYNYLPEKHDGSTVRLVLASFKTKNKGTGSNPAINAKIGASSNNVFSSNITLSANDTWVDSAILIQNAYNTKEYGETEKIIVTTAGTGASELIAKLTYVYE